MVDSLVRETICVERIECLENTAMDFTVWKKYGISPCAIMSGLMNELLSHDVYLSALASFFTACIKMYNCITLPILLLFLMSRSFSVVNQFNTCMWTTVYFVFSVCALILYDKHV